MVTVVAAGALAFDRQGPSHVLHSRHTSPSTGCGTRHLTWIGALWSLPSTVLGVVFGLLCGALPQPRGGLLVVRSDRLLAHLFLTRRGFGAITFGRVVVSAVPLTERLLQHESHHARQYEVLGPYFIPVYLWHQARRGYWRNPLELEAEACAAAWEARTAGGPEGLS